MVQKNEKIIPLQGNAFQMQDMVFDAKNFGLKYGFHHFKISPEKTISREEAFKEFNEIAKEYGFNLDDAVIVEHKKPRATSENSDVHWHVIVPHLNPRTGKALDIRNSYKRNEKLCRLSELRTGQTILNGKHNKSVIKQLQKEGKTAEAQALNVIADAEPAQSAFSTITQKRAERQGISVPKEKLLIEQIWKQADGMKAFVAGLSEAGLTLKEGNKKDTYIIERDGVFIGSVNRLLKKKEMISQRYTERR